VSGLLSPLPPSEANDRFRGRLPGQAALRLLHWRSGPAGDRAPPPRRLGQGGKGGGGSAQMNQRRCRMEGLLARELVAELNDLTRAVRGLVQLVALMLEVEVPPRESPGSTARVEQRLREIVAESTTERD